MGSPWAQPLRIFLSSCTMDLVKGLVITFRKSGDLPPPAPAPSPRVSTILAVMYSRYPAPATAPVTTSTTTSSTTLSQLNMSCTVAAAKARLNSSLKHAKDFTQL